MSLAPGTRLGPYEVTARIGAGGMGEVYRARDTNLRRQVAIKMLPGSVATDRERLARFQREAEVLATFNHPNIAQIYGLERADGHVALVMELVEGPTLADRIAQGSIPLDEALPIARQIAEALEAAHERSIIHRDLKPANVKVRDDGTVKVLDFGLAKTVVPEAVGPVAGASDSPTITTPAMTQMGLILGTAAYMSPEQARGKPVDKRADIWAFGCVLFEMLTGRRAFEGEDVSMTLSTVLQRDPDWSVLPEATPAWLRQLLQRCLRKASKDRLRDIGDVRLALDDALDGLEGAVPDTPRRVTVWQRPVGLALGAIALIAAGAGLTWVLTASRPGTPGAARSEPFRHVNLVLPQNTPLVFVGEASLGIGQTALALSPDGQQLVYVGKGGGTARLFLRRLPEQESQPLAGTDGAYAPCFSADGRWVAFFAGQRLKRIPINGGLPSDVAEANDSYGCSWSADGRIAAVTNDGARLGIVEPRVGRLAPVATFDAAVGLIAQPVWLPGSEWVLATCYPPTHLCAVSTRTGERRHLVLDGAAVIAVKGATLVAGSSPRFIEPGFLVYGAPADNVVMGVRFDPVTLAVQGDPVPLLHGVRRESAMGALQLTTTPTGDAVFAVGANAEESAFVWADRAGVTPLPFERRTHGPFYLSQDGHRIAVKVYPKVGRSELWFLDITTGESRRWIDEGLMGDQELWPGPWIPGSAEALVVGRGVPSSIVLADAIRASGARPIRSGPVTLNTEAIGAGRQVLLRVSPASRPEYLAMAGLAELAKLPGDVERALPPLIPSTGKQVLADLSPDLKWLAYTSDESGPYEVWASRLPPRGPPIRLSNNGGELPRWSPRGDGLYYRNGQRWYWVAVTGLDVRPFAPPEFVLEGDYLEVAGPEYAVSQDGKRLLLLQGSNERETTMLDVLINWRAELERALPSAKR